MCECLEKVTVSPNKFIAIFMQQTNITKRCLASPPTLSIEGVSWCPTHVSVRHYTHTSNCIV